MSDVKTDDYELVDGSWKTLVKQVADGSIIKRFEMTPTPRHASDIVCPHFLELGSSRQIKIETDYCDV